MRIAILGGGFTGLTASYDLAKKGHEVILFEKEKSLGGLAVGFKNKDWDWYLERAYHHLLSSEDDILSFADEIGFEGIFFKSPETASLYETGPVSKFIPTSARDQQQAGKIAARLQEPFLSQHPFHQSYFRIFPLDTPQDFLKFPLLSLPEKIRAGIILAFLKLSPFLSIYEKQTAEEFLKKSMGDKAWKVLWQELFRKKFGKYAENILASFIWARIKKRSKNLGYIEGGFQTFINYLEGKLKSLRVNVLKGYEIRIIEEQGEGFVINNKDKFDAIVSTLPTPVVTKLAEKLLPEKYLNRLGKLEYLHAVVLILETKEPILEKTYWLNVCDEKIPIMIICQQTNFIDKKHYGDKHIAYIGWYVGFADRIWKMEDRELLKFVSPYLNKIAGNKLLITNYYVFKGPFAQPIFDKNFSKNKPDFITPVKNFYIANLDMTYPYDRGTNYAVKLGRQVAEMI